MPGEPIRDPLVEDLPTLLRQRSAIVQPDKLNTIRLMHDFNDDKLDRWFDRLTPGGAGAVPPVTTGNEVMYLVDGKEAFPEMIKAIQSATDPNKHFVYLLGWWLSRFPMIADDPTSPTIIDLLAAASRIRDAITNKSVQVRVMLWDQLSLNTDVTAAGLNAPLSFTLGLSAGSEARQNGFEVAVINNLPDDCGAIIDNRTVQFGSHHQKIVLVNGSDGLIAFCGGIDINPDRIYKRGEHGSFSMGAPYQDVTCRIRGPAAQEVLAIFKERWDDHPASKGIDRRKGVLRALTDPPPVQRDLGRLAVKVGRTYGNTGRHGFSTAFRLSFSGVPFVNTGLGYKFAPGGERTAAGLILQAIDQARRFIYIEDQYLVNVDEAMPALQRALRNIQHLTILIPFAGISDLPDVHFRQKNFISGLRAAGGDKVRVFCPAGVDDLGKAFLPGPDTPHTYVHNKMWIIDDRFAVIGSPNCGRRSWTNDSEACVGITDGPTDRATFCLAHRLRIKLWAQHLNMDTPEGHAELADGVASAIHWVRRPPRAPILPVDENLNSAPILLFDPVFKAAVDPDGR